MPSTNIHSLTRHDVTTFTSVDTPESGPVVESTSTRSHVTGLDMISSESFNIRRFAVSSTPNDYYSTVLQWKPNLFTLAQCSASQQFIECLLSFYFGVARDHCANVDKLKEATVFSSASLWAMRSTRFHQVLSHYSHDFFILSELN
ncbi:hypothetical protein GJ496_010331 [Pomphorhynchus laevis]|nr:hypothetical protein GJ496_010331 [Pomphorhynchus laevis]